MPLGFRQSLTAEDDRTDPGDRTIKDGVQKGRLVLIEPDVSVRDALTVLLQENRWAVQALSDCAQLREVIEQGELTAVISESTLPDCPPEDILQTLPPA